MVEPQFIADALTEERSKASVNRVIHVLEKEGLDFAQFFDFKQYSIPIALVYDLGAHPLYRAKS